jgi:hypothetical protein
MSDFDHELERQLLAVPALPSAHVERVMERVELAERVRRAAPPLPVPMPWWVAILSDRAIVLALVLAAAVLAWGPGIFALALEASRDSAAQPVLRLSGLWANPIVLGAIGLAAAPVLIWLGARLYHWSGNRHSLI